MEIRIQQVVVEALRNMHHVPDNLRKRIDAMAPAGDGAHTMKLSEDDATALAELVQWHVKTDPATGRPTPETQAFADLIRLIDEEMF